MSLNKRKIKRPRWKDAQRDNSTESNMASSTFLLSGFWYENCMKQY
jgi:hypothetical protein